MRALSVPLMVVIGAAAACSSADPGSPPADPVVFAASVETRESTGITTWGFATEGGGTIFHGYDGENHVVAEIRQRFAVADRSTKQYAMRVSGPEVEGSVQIAYIAEWSDTTRSTRFVPHVLKNTIAPGTLAARVVARLAPDATLVPKTAALVPSVHTNAKPLDQPPLVGDTPPDLANACCCDLTTESVGLAGSSASSCVLVEGAPPPLTSGPKSVGRLRPLDVAIDPETNLPYVVSPWERGSYNVISPNCHDAAAMNVSDTNGSITCSNLAWRDPTQGHLVNWTRDPRNPAAAFCAYEGQMPGATIGSGGMCCWEGPADAAGNPLISGTGARNCIAELCLDETVFEPQDLDDLMLGGARVLPPGTLPALPKDCQKDTDSLAACNTCCEEVLEQFKSYDDGKKGSQGLIEYRATCSPACAERDLARQPAPGTASPDGCLPNAAAMDAASRDANGECKPTATSRR